MRLTVSLTVTLLIMTTAAACGKAPECEPAAPVRIVQPMEPSSHQYEAAICSADSSVSVKMTNAETGQSYVNTLGGSGGDKSHLIQVPSVHIEVTMKTDTSGPVIVRIYKDREVIGSATLSETGEVYTVDGL